MLPLKTGTVRVLGVAERTGDNGKVYRTATLFDETANETHEVEVGQELNGELDGMKLEPVRLLIGYRRSWRDQKGGGRLPVVQTFVIGVEPAAA